MSRAKAIFGVLLVFVLGVLCGWLGTQLIHRCQTESSFRDRMQSREEMIVGRIDRKLNLDNRQKERIRMIIHETQQEIRALHNQLRPQTEAIIEQTQQKISQLLTPEQREAYARFIAERQEQTRRKRL